ncbi:MAG: serine O-acetyltransferase [Moraxellaceae bacterium]|nr:MAG: serine O-acetyltransferase [Moraxellaceae bacterium]
MDNQALWEAIRNEVVAEASNEAILASFFHATILNHDSLEAALSFHLANKLDSPTLPAIAVREIIEQAFLDDASIIKAVCQDIRAVVERDPVCSKFSVPLLYFKGLHALEAYRVSHWLWNQGRHSLAFFFQNQISVVFGVDIHPAAKIGAGILLDHGTGIVVGETAVIEDDVSIMQQVTLGGTGKEIGDRHPKIRRGVLVATGAKVLGNVEVGEGAKIAAGSVVLSDVPPHTTVVGVPAKVVGRPDCSAPSLNMDQNIDD